MDNGVSAPSTADNSTNSADLNAVIEAQFSKKFDLPALGQEDLLPGAATWFQAAAPSSKSERLDRFHGLRDGLNATKSRLNRLPLARWHAHTKAQNPAGLVLGSVRAAADPELLTQAWCKFYECLSSYEDLLPPSEPSVGGVRLRTAHLCEAPGAFVTALNHFLAANRAGATDWDWRATTLNPFYEGNCTSAMINDDRFVISSLEKWYFGADDTGDVLDPVNRRDITEVIRSTVGGNVGLDMVTADGSIDCQGDPARQESIVAPLHLAEVAVALALLRPGGSFVLKMFTLFEEPSICLVFLLMHSFEKVSAFKPATSKEGNSEIYLICRGFKGNLSRQQVNLLLQKASCGHLNVFQTSDIPDKVIDVIYECAAKFKELQCSVIERNLASFESKSGFGSQVQALRESVRDEYLRLCNINEKISPERRISPKRVLQSIQECLHIDDRVEHGTFEDRLLGASDRSLAKIKQELLGLRIKGGPFRHVEWTKSPSYLGDVQIVRGRHVEKIRSSKFCPAKVLNLCWEAGDKLQEIMEGETSSNGFKKRRMSNSQEDAAWDEFMGKLCSIYPDLTTSMSVVSLSQPEFLLDGDDDSALQKDTDKLIGLLNSLDRGKKLCVKNLRPLTRVRAGLLFAMGHCFEEIGLVKSRGCSSCVIFSEFTGDPSRSVATLTQLRDALGQSVSPKGAVLQLFPMNRVSPKKLYPLLVQYNFYMVREYLLAVLNDALNR